MKNSSELSSDSVSSEGLEITAPRSRIPVSSPIKSSVESEAKRKDAATAGSDQKRLKIEFNSNSVKFKRPPTPLQVKRQAAIIEPPKAARFLILPSLPGVRSNAHLSSRPVADIEVKVNRSVTFQEIDSDGTLSADDDLSLDDESFAIFQDDLPEFELSFEKEVSEKRTNWRFTLIIISLFVLLVALIGSTVRLSSLQMCKDYVLNRAMEIQNGIERIDLKLLYGLILNFIHDIFQRAANFAKACEYSMIEIVKDVKTFNYPSFFGFFGDQKRIARVHLLNMKDSGNILIRRGQELALPYLEKYFDFHSFLALAFAGSCTFGIGGLFLLLSPM